MSTTGICFANMRSRFAAGAGLLFGLVLAAVSAAAAARASEAMRSSLTTATSWLRLTWSPSRTSNCDSRPPMRARVSPASRLVTTADTAL